MDFRDEDNRTPLHMAAIYGRLSRSKSLIDNQAEVNTVDDKGQTPLHVAAAHGHEMLVGLLLSAGLCNIFLFYRGYVRVGAIASVDFQNSPFAPVDFPKTFRKIENLRVFDWIRVIG